MSRPPSSIVVQKTVASLTEIFSLPIAFRSVTDGFEAFSAVIIYFYIGIRGLQRISAIAETPVGIRSFGTGIDYSENNRKLRGTAKSVPVSSGKEHVP